MRDTTGAGDCFAGFLVGGLMRLAKKEGEQSVKETQAVLKVATQVSGLDELHDACLCERERERERERGRADKIKSSISRQPVFVSRGTARKRPSRRTRRFLLDLPRRRRLLRPLEGSERKATWCGRGKGVGGWRACLLACLPDPCRQQEGSGPLIDQRNGSVRLSSVAHLLALIARIAQIGKCSNQKKKRGGRQGEKRRKSCKDGDHK
jgi:hypothetical protein